MKKSSSNYLEQKGNVMVFVAGIAHVPEGAARGTRTSDPRRGLSTTVLTHGLSLSCFYLCWPLIGFVLHTSPFK